MAKVAELEEQVAALQQRREDVRIISIAYDADGRLLAASSSALDTAASLKASKVALTILLQQTDMLLLAAVEREAKNGAGPA